MTCCKNSNRRTFAGDAITPGFSVDLTLLERRRGLRYIIEVKPGTPMTAVQSLMRSQLGAACQVEPLFPDFDSRRDLPRMANFYLAILPDVSQSDFNRNLFDIAYKIQRQAKVAVRSVVPDIPRPIMQPPSPDEPCWSDKDVPQDRLWSVKNMKIPEAHDFLRSGGERCGGGIVIGHPDTGYSDHERLRNLDLDQDYDFIAGDDNARDPLPTRPIRGTQPGHGTATGSIIVSRCDNDMWGVAPDAALVPLRCVYSVVLAGNSEVIQAIHYATRKEFHILSMSLGGLRGINEGLRIAVNNAVFRNLIVVAAAGNCVPFVVSPAWFRYSISVAGSNVQDKPWKGKLDGPGSSFGLHVDIAAPAENVWTASTFEKDEHNNWELQHSPSGQLIPTTTQIAPGQGTSFAAAAVAGIAALWLSHHDRKNLLDRYGPSGIPLQEVFRSVLRQSARRGRDWSPKYGPGIIDALGVLKETLWPPSVFQRPQDLEITPILDWFLTVLHDLDPRTVKKRLSSVLNAGTDAELDSLLTTYGPELLSVLQDEPEALQNFIDEACKQVADAGDRAREVVEELGEKVSQTLQNVVRRR